jgi:deoxyribonuclease-4
MIRLGFHMSIAGSVANSARDAASLGYSAFQIFTTSSRSWKHNRPGSKDAEEFRSIVEQYGMAPNAHVPYLCNPSSPDKETRKKSLAMLVANMENCNDLGIRHLVVHMGSHLGKGIDIGLSNLADTVTAALDSVDKVGILLENSAGYTNSVGSNFPEIGRALSMCSSKRVGLCLDTCHAFAAGYDLTSQEAAKAMFADLRKHVGEERLLLFHLNDAKFPLGSGLDRHWHIGKGYIGEKGISNIFAEKIAGSSSFIMETPENEEGNDSSNLSATERLISKA